MADFNFIINTLQIMVSLNTGISQVSLVFPVHISLSSTFQRFLVITVAIVKSKCLLGHRSWAVTFPVRRFNLYHQQTSYDCYYVC